MPITGLLTSVNGSVVTLTIQGTASCQQIDIDWGDGTLDQAGGALPTTAQHAYQKGRTYIIRATGQKNCKDQSVSISVTVEEKRGGGGIKTAIPKASFLKAFAVAFIECATPKIESLVPFVSFPTPGGVLVLKGCGFGNDDSDGFLSVFLHLTDYTGAQVAPLSLRVLSRADNAVAAEIPYDISGVMDQLATVQIHLGKQLSAPFSIGFRARRV